MAAAHIIPNAPIFPVLHGMLRASAQTIEGPRPCDSFDVFLDDAGDLVVLLLDSHSTAETNDGLAASWLAETRRALHARKPLHTVVNALEMQLAARPSAEVALVILRLSQRDAKVEVLNAGMPPVAVAGPGEHVDLHLALSGPVGRRVGEVHPYELVPPVWGSTWLAVSDGMMNGSLEPENVLALCAKLGLCERGLALTASTSEDQYDAFQGLLTQARFVRDDASFVLVAADPSARFQSGIA